MSFLFAIFQSCFCCDFSACISQLCLRSRFQRKTEEGLHLFLSQAIYLPSYLRRLSHISSSFLWVRVEPAAGGGGAAAVRHPSACVHLPLPAVAAHTHTSSTQETGQDQRGQSAPCMPGKREREREREKRTNQLNLRVSFFFHFSLFLFSCFELRTDH